MAKTAFGLLAGYFLLALTVYAQNQPVLTYNYEYSCNNERVVVGHCRRDSDTPDMPRTTDADNFCMVYYPDRPKQGGFTVQKVELRGDIVKKLQDCGAFAPPTNSQSNLSASGPDAIALSNALTAPQLASKEARDLRAAKNETAALAKFDSAIAKYKEIIANYPASRYPGVTSAYTGLGKIYMIDLRRYDLALPVWQGLRKLQPNDPTNAVLVGQALSQLKRRDEALVAFREALVLRPTEDLAVIVHLAINYIYKDQGLYDKAVPECQEVLRIDPANSGAYHSLGINYYYLKENQKAIDAFQQAIKLKYTPVEQPYNWIGFIYNELGQHDKALPVLQTVLAINPNYANTHGNLGLAFIGLKRFTEAVAELQQTIKLDPTNSQSRYNLGYAYAKMGKKADAMAVYNQLLTMDKAKAQELLDLINNPGTQATNKGNGQVAGPTNKPASPTSLAAQEHLSKGNQFFNDRDFDKAIAEYQAIIALKPEKKILLEAYSGLADSYSFLLDINKAIPNYLQMTILDPEDSSKFWVLGNAYFQTQQYAKAATAFKEAIRLKPTEKLYYSDLGQAYLMLGQKAAAMQVYESLLKVDKDGAKSLLEQINDPGGPATVLALKSEILLLGERDLGPALRYLKAASLIKPANPYGLMKVAEAFDLWDLHDEAIDIYRRVIALKPKSETQAEAFGYIGQAYNAKEQYAKAIPELKESLRIKPDDYMARELGNAYFNLKDYTNALAVYQQAVTLKPDNADGHYLIGMTYAAMNQFDKSIAAYTDVARLEPKSGRGFAQIGKVNFQLRKYPDAGRAFGSALRIDPKNKEALMGIGKTYIAVGRKADAMKAYTALKPLDEKLAQDLLNEINKP